MTTPTPDRTPTGDLRERLAEALTREHYRRASERIEAPPEEHCAGFADAVLPIVEAALAEQARLAGADIAGRADSYRVAIRQLEARVTSAEAAVQRVRDLAEDMRTWCSPHGVAADYAKRIFEALDQPEETPDA